MIVNLTPAELSMAREVAEARQKVHRDTGRARAGTVIASALYAHMQGAQAELAVAKHFGLEWSGKLFDLRQWLVYRSDGRDVGKLEVRSTTHPNGRLILHPNDKDDAPFVLVLSHRAPEFTLRGWIMGKDGKRDEFWWDMGYGKPCYYVPTLCLHNMLELGAKGRL